jgi:hypothetical protein
MLLADLPGNHIISGKFDYQWIKAVIIFTKFGINKCQEVLNMMP